jgi:hypothetical protein
MSDVAVHYELIFRPLSGRGSGHAFPCDPGGHVDLDALDERVRNDYLFARALVGWSLAPPVVHECAG